MMRKSQWGEKQASTNEEQWMNAKLATRLWSWCDDTLVRWDSLLLVLVEIVWKLSFLLKNWLFLRKRATRPCLSADGLSLITQGVFANSMENGGMRRGELTDHQWEQLQPLLPPQKPKAGRPAEDHRRIINGIFWSDRTRALWAAEDCGQPDLTLAEGGSVAEDFSSGPTGTASRWSRTA